MIKLVYIFIFLYDMNNYNTVRNELEKLLQLSYKENSKINLSNIDLF